MVKAKGGQRLFTLEKVGDHTSDILDRAFKHGIQNARKSKNMGETRRSPTRRERNAKRLSECPEECALTPGVTDDEGSGTRTRLNDVRVGAAWFGIKQNRRVSQKRAGGASRARGGPAAGVRFEKAPPPPPPPPRLSLERTHALHVTGAPWKERRRRCWRAARWPNGVQGQLSIWNSALNFHSSGRGEDDGELKRTRAVGDFFQNTDRS